MDAKSLPFVRFTIQTKRPNCKAETAIFKILKEFLDSGEMNKASNAATIGVKIKYVSKYCGILSLYQYEK
jgi:hypothetical protein